MSDLRCLSSVNVALSCEELFAETSIGLSPAMTVEERLEAATEELEFFVTKSLKLLQRMLEAEE